MTDTSANLGLPFIQPAQAQKHVTHNEALERLDIVAQLVIRELDAQTPPTAPEEGDVYALGATPDGLWAGQAGNLAAFQNGGWNFVLPKDGWLASTADGTILVHADSAWVEGGGSDTLDILGIGTTADLTNRLAVSSDATLLTHNSGGHQVKVNKNAQTDTASLLFQSGWTGHAEIGLCGTDDLSLKVSADGSQWIEALSVSSLDGSVTFGHLVQLPPIAEPQGATGTVYFDQTTLKLRCHDGSAWHDLY